MHYAIYLPGKQGANPAHLESVGLGSLGTDGGVQFADAHSHTPDGKSGLMAVWGVQPAMNPAFYDWQPAKACSRRELSAGRFWFGQHAESPLTPKDCERKVIQLGYGIPLRDKQVWRIPAAVNLPHYHGLNGDGEYERWVADEYREFWRQSERYAVEFFKAIDQLEQLRLRRPDLPTDSTVEFTLKDAWEFCCAALAINYRLTPELIDLLGLIDDGAMRNIIKAAIDLPVILEANDQKKTEEFSIPVTSIT